MEEIKKEPVTTALVLLNILIFLAAELTGGTRDLNHMVEFGAMYAPLVRGNGDAYRLFTSMFLHFGIEHLINNMLLLFVLGGRLERTAGKIRFLLIYLLGGLGGNILSLCLETGSDGYAVSAGASGAVFAVMGAMIYVIIRNKGRVEDLSVKQMLIMAGLSLYFGFTSSGVDNAAHVGGLLSGIILAVILYHPRKI